MPGALIWPAGHNQHCKHADIDREPFINALCILKNIPKQNRDFQLCKECKGRSWLKRRKYLNLNLFSVPALKFQITEQSLTQWWLSLKLSCKDCTEKVPSWHLGQPLSGHCSWHTSYPSVIQNCFCPQNSWNSLDFEPLHRVHSPDETFTPLLHPSDFSNLTLSRTPPSLDSLSC